MMKNFLSGLAVALLLVTGLYSGGCASPPAPTPPAVGHDPSRGLVIHPNHWWKERKLKQGLTDNGDGTVTDEKTGLIWQQGENRGTYNWKEALSHCEGLKLAGKSDWRLPNVDELVSIVDYGRYQPAIDTAYFPGVKSSSYWSSTTHVGHTSNAWSVYFNSGDVNYYGKTSSYYVRCAR